MESIRRLPGLSGMIILLLLNTNTNPGASPLGEASHSPNLFAVDSTRKGDLDRKSTQWWSNDEITFFKARSLGSPNIFRNSTSVEIIDFISLFSIPTNTDPFFSLFSQNSIQILYNKVCRKGN
ncbi:Phosphohydrolase (MutT/nudix family protein) [Bacillus thuringiensis serovar pulsiensis BGSC 4CC1]|nr:Phosphohydrolase (MutT/nudix family protein) [Bacillus thuringiensis serovar pulsiensis BGSC 4CC1]